MRQTLKLYTVATLTGLIITGCGGGSATTDKNTDNPTKDKSISTTKVYNVTVVSDPVLPTSICKGATGTLIIKEDNTVSGTVDSEWGKSYNITGTHIPENGIIEGGFADAGTQVATYKGVADDQSADGTWKDANCYGTWSGKIKKY